MNLGAFSISLAVRDLEASRAFYEALGFTAFHGESAHGWLMLKNGEKIDAKWVGSDSVHRDPSDTLWLDGKATNPAGG